MAYLLYSYNVTRMTQKKGHAGAVRRMSKNKRLFLEAYEKSMGNVSASCKAVNLSRQTYYRWLDEDLNFAKLCEDVLESNIDYAETKLMSNIREGKETSLIFYLKTKGKSRGYKEEIGLEQTTITRSEFA